MSRKIADWKLHLTWFAAGICATGALWYFLSIGEAIWAIATGVCALLLAGYAVSIHIRNDRSRDHARADQLATFLSQAQALQARLAEPALPFADHNEWVSVVEAYLDRNLGPAYRVAFGDFSGMVFYGDGSERFVLSKSLQGRSRRLHEFMAELRT